MQIETIAEIVRGLDATGEEIIATLLVLRTYRCDSVKYLTGDALWFSYEEYVRFLVEVSEKDLLGLASGRSGVGRFTAYSLVIGPLVVRENDRVRFRREEFARRVVGLAKRVCEALSRLGVKDSNS